jgi:hypothetical protein
VSANGSAVDHLDVAIVRGGDGINHPIPHACLSPPHQTVVAGGACAIAFWQIAPRRTGSLHPKDAIQHASIIDTRYALRLVRQQRLDHAPLEVGQVISAHADAESEHTAIWKSSVLTWAD